MSESRRPSRPSRKRGIGLVCSAKSIFRGIADRCCRSRGSRARCVFWAVATVSAIPPMSSAYATDMAAVRSLLDQTKFPEAIDLLVKELEENPAHEAARILLADAYEKAGEAERAVATWKEVAAMSHSDEKD